jgi:uncharacterized protein (DUF1330 family)
MTAYWIARVNVTDEAEYAKYAALAGPATARHGGRILARGGRTVTFEGTEYARNVIVEFPSIEAAETCYNSPEYQEALTFAKGAADRLLCVVEGV